MANKIFVNNVEFEVVDADARADITALETTVSGKANTSDMYTKSAVDTALGNKADVSTTYTKTETNNLLNAKASASDIPTTLAQLTDDATHRVVTDDEKASWNAKSTFSGDYNDLTNRPTIPVVPTNVSAFTNDSGYFTLATLPIYTGVVV